MGFALVLRNIDPVACQPVEDHLQFLHNQRFFLLAFAAPDLDGAATKQMNNDTIERTEIKDPYFANSLCEQERIQIKETAEKFEEYCKSVAYQKTNSRTTDCFKQGAQ